MAMLFLPQAQASRHRTSRRCRCRNACCRHPVRPSHLLPSSPHLTHQPLAGHLIKVPLATAIPPPWPVIRLAICAPLQSIRWLPTALHARFHTTSPHPHTSNAAICGIGPSPATGSLHGVAKCHCASARDTFPASHQLLLF